MKIRINPRWKREGLTWLGLLIMVAIIVIIVAGIALVIVTVLQGLSKLLDKNRPVDPDDQPESISRYMETLPPGAEVQSVTVYAVDYIEPTAPESGFPAYTYTVEFSTNLVHWAHLTNWSSASDFADWTMPVDGRPCGFFRITRHGEP